ncbi:unnamed protein product, partial [Larinioides sclopetarius]
KGCLGRDGLHLNFRGNHELEEDFAKQIENRISSKYLYHRKARSIDNGNSSVEITQSYATVESTPSKEGS